MQHLRPILSPRRSPRASGPWILLWPLLATLLPAPAARAAIPRPATAVSVTAKGLQPLTTVPLFRADRVDPAALAVEDGQRERQGLAPRFAIPQQTTLSPETDGLWERLDDDTLLWRLRIASAGAVSLNLGLTRYHMPRGGRLLLYPAGAPGKAIMFDDTDNAPHGQLWTPVIPTDDLVLEVVLPVKARNELDLLVGSVNVGYRTFGQALVDKSGACNVDVVCPEGDPWRNEIPAVGAISTGGSLFCTGFMVNNTAQDQTPLFMTANHCGLSSGNAASLVVYWNFESPTCGQHGGGSLAQNQSGATFLSASAASDFTLVRLDDDPDPDWRITFAGWSRSSADPTSAVCIHQPSGDEKSISFENDPLSTTDYLGTAVPGDGTHLRVTDWDVGTTEPGSSGSPLFDQDHHVVGQLHGGYAACDNDTSDWFGRFSVSWNGGGTAATRLSDWLDPDASGAMSLDTFNPWANAIRISGTGLSSSGPEGGPFAPDSSAVVLDNPTDHAIPFLITTDVDWVSPAYVRSSLAPGGTFTHRILLNSRAADLGPGIHRGTITIENLLDGLGDTTRPLTLTVGTPALAHDFPLDNDPGWTTGGQWQFGIPQGGGGQFGRPDPTAGATGENVYGYNLAGDYPNNMPEYDLTTTAIDCTHLVLTTLRFQRWLNVEQNIYDHATVCVSNDSIHWTTVWENGITLQDRTWQPVAYDISQVADNQPTVYVRWTMGPTNASWQFSGWNIDDVEIWGIDTSSAPPPVAPVDSLDLIRPNPFNVTLQLSFGLAHDGPARIDVFDLRGRRIKVLVAREFTAGFHTAQWDGRDEAGRPAPSGNYLFRLRTAWGTHTRGGTLIR